jgi:putative membrane protein
MDNAVSQSLAKDAQQAKAHLSTLKGAAFDRAYIEREIGYHQAVLDAIDEVLLPTTDNAELKQLLTDVRPAIASHLERAQQIKASLK